MKARKAITASQRNEVLAKTDGHCAYCGCPIGLDEMQVDHVISLHNHGADSIGNMMPSCHDCNYYKGGCNPEGFRRKLKRAFRKTCKCNFVRRLEQKYIGWDDNNQLKIHHNLQFSNKIYF